MCSSLDGKKALQGLFEYLAYIACCAKENRTRQPPVAEPLLAVKERQALVARKSEALGFGGTWAPEADRNDDLSRPVSGGANSASGSGSSSSGASGGGGGAAANDDDEVEMVGGSGNGHDYTLPHLRFNCVTHPWQPHRPASNNTCCPECYCYICDLPASKCALWPDAHCHAADQDEQHVALRRANKDLTW